MAEQECKECRGKGRFLYDDWALRLDYDPMTCTSSLCESCQGSGNIPLWVTKDGTHILVTDMSDRHLSRVTKNLDNMVRSVLYHDLFSSKIEYLRKANFYLLVMRREQELRKKAA